MLQLSSSWVERSGVGVYCGGAKIYGLLCRVGSRSSRRWGGAWVLELQTASAYLFVCEDLPTARRHLDHFLEDRPWALDT